MVCVYVHVMQQRIEPRTGKWEVSIAIWNSEYQNTTSPEHLFARKIHRLICEFATYLLVTQPGCTIYMQIACIVQLCICYVGPELYIYSATYATQSPAHRNVKSKSTRYTPQLAIPQSQSLALRHRHQHHSLSPFNPLRQHVFTPSKQDIQSARQTTFVFICDTRTFASRAIRYM